MTIAALVAATLAGAAQQQGTACAFHDERGTVVPALGATPQFEAGRNPVFASGRFSYAGATYVKFGAPRQMAPAEVEAFGDLGGVPLFIAAGSGDDSVVYVMVGSADCSFQWFEKQ